MLRTLKRSCLRPFSISRRFFFSRPFSFSRTCAPSRFVSAAAGLIAHQMTTTHCNTLQHNATHCSTQFSYHGRCYSKTDDCTTLHHTAATLQHTATHSSAATVGAIAQQITATHCHKLQHTATQSSTTAVGVIAQQITATHCNTLQHRVQLPR